jgi:hypothetical protein
MGGLLTLPTFVETFPEMDTISKHITAEQKSKNSTIQGVAMLSVSSPTAKLSQLNTHLFLMALNTGIHTTARCMKSVC